MRRATRTTLAVAWLAVAWLATLGAATADAQLARPAAELRLDALVAREPAAHAGLGVALATAPMVRVVGIVGVGVVRRRDETTTGSVRGEVVARFLFDPYAARGSSVYAGGGLGLRRDGGGEWGELLVLVAGIERRAPGRPTTALELGVGGGVRVGVAVRQAPRRSERR